MRLDGVQGIQGDVGVVHVHEGPAAQVYEAVRDARVNDDAHDPPVHTERSRPGQGSGYDRVGVAPGSSLLIRESGKKRLAWTTSESATRSSP